MNSNEWPLVFFTLLSQISLGILFSWLVLSLSLKNTDIPAFGDLKRVMLIAALGSMGIALIISFLHLALPMHSVYALSNIGSSWLSREILLASFYLFLIVIAFISFQFNIPHRSIANYLLLAAILAGVALIWSMARVYMIPTVPLWNTPATLVAFFNTALLLGSGATLVILTVMLNKGLSLNVLMPVHTTLFYLLAAGVFIGLLNMLLLQPDMTVFSGSFHAPEISGLWQTGQTLFLLIGFSLITYWFAFKAPAINGPISLLIYGAMACFLLSELFGRYIFYASYYRVGI